jgi:multicomponent Na+:H+ antiporter subunit G
MKNSSFEQLKERAQKREQLRQQRYKEENDY